MLQKCQTAKIAVWRHYVLWPTSAARPDDQQDGA